MSQPKTLAGFQAVLIESYHDACIKDGLVYDREAAEIAIKSSSCATFKVLAALNPKAMVKAVKEIAASAPY